MKMASARMGGQVGLQQGMRSLQSIILTTFQMNSSLAFCLNSAPLHAILETSVELFWYAENTEACYTVGMDVIGLLSTCASASAVLTREMIETGTSSILKDILTASGIVSQMVITPFTDNLTNKLYMIVSIVNELLPSVSNEKISFLINDDTGLSISTTNFALRILQITLLEQSYFKKT
ncbi:hypothetical protein SUGI_0754990 [Cryptomeria japonica]|nr:hypothetical protein SUGI_0754990 [Cryptomeria japonica]